MKFDLKPEGLKHFMKIGLSNSEIAVIGSVMNNPTSKQVAEDLFVSEKTIKYHLTNIYKKLNVKKKNEMVLLVYPYFTPEHKPEGQAPAKIDFTQTLGSNALPRGNN